MSCVGHYKFNSGSRSTHRADVATGIYKITAIYRACAQHGLTLNNGGELRYGKLHKNRVSRQLTNNRTLFAKGKPL